MLFISVKKNAEHKKDDSEEMYRNNIEWYWYYSTVEEVNWKQIFKQTWYKIHYGKKNKFLRNEWL